MKLIATFALVTSGCSFSLRLDGTSDAAAGSDARADAEVDAPGIDAPVIDAAPPIDAGPDAMPSWVQIDQITVPCSGLEVLSSVTLTASTTYRLRATGTCIANNSPIAGPDVQGDAEYIWNNVSTEDESGGVDMGIGINDTTVDMTRTPNWGAFTNTHAYSVMFLGLGAKIIAKYHDPNYGNNSGSLTVFVDSFQ